MPRPTPNIIEAASRCFHYNMSMLVPDYIVIRSPKRGTYAVTTIGMYELNHAAAKADDWVIAINLSSEDIMSLMGIIPRKPADEPTVDTVFFYHPPSDPPSEKREVKRNLVDQPQHDTLDSFGTACKEVENASSTENL